MKLSPIINTIILTTLTLITFTTPISATSKPHHTITFRAPNLYPVSIAYDPRAQHFVVSSIVSPTILSVSDAGVTHTLINSGTVVPELINASFAGIAVDSTRRRLLVVVHRLHDPTNSALVAFDLETSPHGLVFLAPLRDAAGSNSAAPANDVAVDYDGNAYVTNSASNLIWKVNADGQTSILSGSRIFAVERENDDSNPCGLNGILYNSKGYLLVTQSNTGKLFKVDAEDGRARRVILNKDLTNADGVALRRDGVLLVVSQHKLYFIKSDSGWSEGAVYDETTLDEERFATSVTVGGDDRVYVLYGHVNEGIMGNSQREVFGIVEIRSEEESGDEKIWVYVLVGLGLAYFMFWRFQMKQLATNMNKKTQ